VILVKKKVIILILLVLIISTSLVFASSEYLFDKYGVRKNMVQQMSVEDIVELDRKDNVSIDKEWTIEFNQQVQLDEIFAMSIKKADEILSPAKTFDNMKVCKGRE